MATALVRHLLAKGHRVVVTYRDDAKLAAAGFSGDIVAVKVPDLLAPGAVEGLVGSVERLDCLPDCLVNNACDLRWQRMDPDGHVPEECFVNHYRINVVVPYELSWRLVNQKHSRLRKIINISSMYGVVPYNPQLYLHPETETPPQYAVAKAALIHLTKDLAIRFRERGVMVNAVSYGGVEGRADNAFKRRFESVTPLKRMMRPEETVPVIDFLLNDESGYMTGQNLIVDGGRTVW